MSSGTSGISRPTPLQASAAMPPFSAQSNAAAAALADAMAARGSSTADPLEVAVGGRAGTPPAASGAADLHKQEDPPAPLRGQNGQSGIQVAISVMRSVPQQLPRTCPAFKAIERPAPRKCNSFPERRSGVLMRPTEHCPVS